MQHKMKIEIKTILYAMRIQTAEIDSQSSIHLRSYEKSLSYTESADFNFELTVDGAM